MGAVAVPMGLAVAAVTAGESGVEAGGDSDKEKGSAEQPVSMDVTGSRSLRAHATARGLLVGTAVIPSKLTNAMAVYADMARERLDAGASERPQVSGNPYADLVREQSSILVAENAMKWAAIHPAADRYSFEDADAMYAFAEANGQKVRGHNLLWHEAMPPWVLSTVTKDNARQVVAKHIQTVAGRYKGRTHSWDVVNEAIDLKDGRPDGFRVTPWLNWLGDDYIEFAFRTASQADPNARLTYNDYGFELETPDDTAKRAQILLLLRRLKARGVPIHAMGVQSHLMAGTGKMPGEGLRQFVREVGRMGLEVYITELDVNDHDVGGNASDQDRAVATVYDKYLTMMLAEPNVNAVLTWGISNRYSWLNHGKYMRPDGVAQRPLPFDADFKPNSAFFAMRDAIDKRVPSGATRGPVGASSTTAPATAAPSPGDDPYAPFTPKPQSPAPKK